MEIPSIDAWALHEQAMARNISIAPGPMFSPKGKFKNCIRLNCGLDWSPRVERALIVLGELARRLS